MMTSSSSLPSNDRLPLPLLRCSLLLVRAAVSHISLALLAMQWGTHPPSLAPIGLHLAEWNHILCGIYDGNPTLAFSFKATFGKSSDPKENFKTFSKGLISKGMALFVDVPQIAG